MEPEVALAAAVAQLRAANRADALRHAADAEVNRCRVALDSASTQHALEVADVARLERLSVTRVLAALRQSRESDLERERTEADAAAYQVAAAQAQLEAADRAAQTAAVACDAFGDVDAAYDAALRDQEAWIRQQDPVRARQLAAIGERRGALESERIEIAEAVAAGTTARLRALAAYERLRDADSTSAIDTWFGGGLIVSAIKHHQLDDVTDLLVRADAALTAFGRELEDLKLADLPAATIGPLEMSFDVFFDNIFSDLMVRDRIKDTKAALTETSRRVDELLADLAERGIAVEDEIDACATERETVLIR